MCISIKLYIVSVNRRRGSLESNNRLAVTVTVAVVDASAGGVAFLGSVQSPTGGTGGQLLSSFSLGCESSSSSCRMIPKAAEFRRCYAD